jgi:hypothetical protein
MPNKDPLATAYKYAAVTPSDTVDVGPFRSLYVGGAGNVAVVDRFGGAAVVFTAVPAGTVLPVQGKRVDNTNTTATAIVALF